jgi:hypothetical protein
VHSPGDRLQQVIGQSTTEGQYPISCWDPRSMRNSTRCLVTLFLALLWVADFSVRAEDQPMARAPLPPPLPVSPLDAQSAPSAATPETQRAPKPVAGESVQNGNWKRDPIRRTHSSSSKLKHAAAADRTASSSVKRAVKDKHPVPPRPPDQIDSSQQVAGAMPFPGPPPPLHGYYPGYPPGYAPYPPAYQYPWPRGPASPW